MKTKVKGTLALGLSLMLLAGGCGTAPAQTSQQPAEQSSPQASAQNTQEEKTLENTYTMNEESVKLCGRTYLSSDGILWCSLSGSGAEFDFEGTKLDLLLRGDNSASISSNEDNYARYAVYIDGERAIDGYMDAPEKTVNLISSDSAEKHRIRFIKLSETAMSNIGLKAAVCEGTIAPAAERDLKLEFIGDSITCGYGVDDENAAHHFKTITEDCTKAYAYKAALSLDADLSLFSISGWGIISGYTEGDKPITNQRLPKYYKKTGFSYALMTEDNENFTPQSINWDFSRYVPDIIVINLGTNDDSYCKGIEERCLDYAENYTEFLTTVHECSPTSKILCILGLMGDRLYPYVEKAAADFKEKTGFEQIYTLKLTVQDSSVNGYAADFHPTAASHDIAAKEVAEKIKEIR